MDITPLVPAGRQLVQSYGGGGFRISGLLYTGSVIVFPERTIAWPVADVGAVTPASLEAVMAAGVGVGILLVGCGREFVPPPPDLAGAVRASGVVLEWMDTGAACRTFNVLMGEDRAAAAALVAVD